MDSRYQVVIVGGGPVGVGLAVHLGLRGVACAVIERRTEQSKIPKGQGLSQRTLEHFYFWGIADDIRAARTMPEGYPIGHVTSYETLMSNYWHATQPRTVVQSYYFQANERLPQYRTEAVLRQRMAELNSVDDYIGWNAIEVRQDPNGASILVEKEGTQQTLHAEYVVGCDGGHSLVREQLDIRRSGTDWSELMALVVFRSRELHQALERFPERSTYRVMHPALKGYWMFFGRVDVGEEFFFHAPVPEATASNLDFTTLLHEAAGFAFDCEIEHVGFWDLRVQVADEYQSGRAFIAGDAAHTHPPYGGFGLNNGLEDAVNLGWKLAAVLEGWGGDRLLYSYSLERQPIFRDVGEDIIGGWISDDRRFLEEHSPEKDPEEFEGLFKEMAEGFGKRLREYEPHYEGSPVVIGPPAGVTSAHGIHGFEAKAGHHLPPQPLSSGRNVFEQLGFDFTLIALDAEPGSVRMFEANASSLRIPLRVVCDTFAGGREKYGARLILVRPDQYVAWAGDKPPDDVHHLLRKVTGRD